MRCSLPRQSCGIMRLGMSCSSGLVVSICGFTSVSPAEITSPREFSQCRQTRADGPAFDRNPACLVTAGITRLPENSPGWNYTGWTSSHPHSPRDGSGCRQPSSGYRRKGSRLAMRKELYWLEESWPGKLAVAPRPRGGDWLTDDIASWKRAKVNSVLSLLTPMRKKTLISAAKRAKSGPKGWTSHRFRYQIARFRDRRRS